MKTLIKAVLLVSVLSASLGSDMTGDGVAAVPVQSGRPGSLRANLDFGRMPLAFIENDGQLDQRAAYYVIGGDKSLYFGPDGVTIALTHSQTPSPAFHGGDEKRGSGLTPNKPRHSCRGVEGLTHHEPSKKAPGGKIRNIGGIPAPCGRSLVKRWTVKLEFLGANPGARPAGQGRTETVMSFFRGKPEQWRAGVATYSRLVYKDLWPGIDLVYSGTADRLKYEFVVRPGADPSSIRLAYKGATGLGLGGDGGLEVATPAGAFRDDAPVAFQPKAGGTEDVPVAFALEGTVGRVAAAKASDSGTAPESRVYGFTIGDYDRTQPLILDPATLIYCGYIGGSIDDRGTAVAIDASGNAYVTGWTGSYDFPVKVGPDLLFNSQFQGRDAFVAKVNAAGTALVYCGFIGGGWDDAGTGIAVDSLGNAYVVGWTFSMDFPAIVGPSLTHHSNISQYSEAFITKVNATGTGLLYSGFIGGTLNDQATGVALDSSKNAYVTGWTESNDIPRIAGPDLSYNGGRDAFVAKVNAAGTGFVYSGYVGGTAADAGTAIAVDDSGCAFITGYTNSHPSENFPVKTGPSLLLTAVPDAFVAKVNAAGTGLVYCGYIGGISEDYGTGIAADKSGHAYVVGYTNSATQFPVTVGPFLQFSGGQDAFIAKVDASGVDLVYCGYIGGTGDDYGNGVAVDGQGNAYVAGSTDAQYGFPVSGGLSSTVAGLTDAFVVTVKPSGEGLFYGGFIGGSDNDAAAGVAADGLGNVFVAGFTRSNDFPVTVGPILTPGALYGISEDAFVARITEKLPPLAPVSLTATSVNLIEIDLTWTDKSNNEDGFKIERKIGQAGTWSEIATVDANTTTYNNTGLSEGTLYFYRVLAFNDIGDSAYSNEFSVTTVPVAPSDLVATAINSREVDLTWVDHSGHETGFKIQRRVGAGDPWVQIGTSVANATAYQDHQVVEETTYSYRVLAYDDGGDSTPSNMASATTPALTIPSAPTNLQAAAVSPFNVNLMWTDNSYDEDGFKIERKTGAGGVWAQISIAGPNVTVFHDSGLSESTNYVYRVRAYNNAGNSDYSNEAGVTTPVYRPRLRVPIADIAFGNVNICSQADRTTVLYNDGTAPLSVTGVASSSVSGELTYVGPAVPFTIPASESRAITVRFAPHDPVSTSADFTVTSNDPDTPTAVFHANGTGTLPTITLALQAQRLVERAWIIRRQYAKLELAVGKSAPFNVTSYRLSRKVGNGAYAVVTSFTETSLQNGQLTYIDKYLDANTNYAYKIDALDCLGRIITTSNEALLQLPVSMIQKSGTPVKK